MDDICYFEVIVGEVGCGVGEKNFREWKWDWESDEIVICYVLFGDNGVLG